MSLNEGDTLYLECWSLQKGHYVTVCKVVEKSETTAKLRPEKELYAGGNEMPIHPSSQKVMEQPLEHLEKPFEQRLREMKEFAEWFIDKMTQPE